MKKIIFCALLLSVQMLFGQSGIGVHFKIDSTDFFGMMMTYPKVVEVIQGSPAEGAGIKTGDLMVAIDGQTTLWSSLDTIRNMIIGEAGTTVKITVERNNLRQEISVVRSFNLSSVSASTSAPVQSNSSSSGSGEFCSVLSAIMNDGSDYFKQTKDTNDFVKEEGYFTLITYQSKVKVPGAQKVTVESRLGSTCVIDYGTFYDLGSAKATADKVYNQIKSCYPSYYAYNSLQKSDSVRVYFGKEYSDGFSEAQMELTMYVNKTGSYAVKLSVFGGEISRYYSISTPSYNNNFTSSMLKIYNDIPNNYSNVKGTKHVSQGLFSSISYDITPMPQGAHDCTLYEGGFSLGNGCGCRYFLGPDHEAALSTFNQLAEAMKNALGSEFMYITESSKLDMTMPSKAEATIIFGKKKNRVFESMPLIGLSLTKEDNDRYLVKMYFYRFGF
ncbi:MAG: PDZ domain-containing protein [Flavobacteriales bacterium]